MKVNFIVIGAQKSGTTSLATILQDHQKITFCKKKEPNFWCSTINWKQDIEKYHDMFDQSENDQLYGEASTSYSMSPIFNDKKAKRGFHLFPTSRFHANQMVYSIINPNIAEDLYEYNPSLKLVYIVRDPYKRIVSQYKHFYQRGYFKKGINRAVVNERSLIDISRYYTQVLPYINLFGRKQVLILDFDELKNNQEKVKEKLSNFLGIDQQLFMDSDTVHANKTSAGHPLYIYDKYPGRIRKILSNIIKRKADKNIKLNEDSKAIIKTMLQPEVDQLRVLMNDELSHWQF